MVITSILALTVAPAAPAIPTATSTKLWGRGANKLWTWTGNDWKRMDWNPSKNWERVPKKT